MKKNSLKYLNLEEINDLIGTIKETIKETQFSAIYNKTEKLKILEEYKQKIENGEIEHLDLNDITLEEAKFFNTALNRLESDIAAHKSHVCLAWHGPSYNVKLHLKIQDYIETPPSVMLTTKEVAEKLRVKKGTVYGYIHDGFLPAIRIGNSKSSFLIDSHDLEAYINKLKKEALKKSMRDHAKRDN